MNSEEDRVVTRGERGNEQGGEREIDVLISRIIDGEARRGDVARFDAIAADEPGAYRDLELARREADALGAQVGRLVSRADVVELPIAGYTPERREVGARAGDTGDGFAFLFSMFRWTGWVAAALLMIAWVVNTPMTATPTDEQTAQNGTNTEAAPEAGTRVVRSAREALDAYSEFAKRAGMPIDELPGRVLVDSRPSATGEGYDVTYVRRFVERETVPSLFRFGVNESGAPTLVPAGAGTGGVRSVGRSF